MSRWGDSYAPVRTDYSRSDVNLSHAGSAAAAADQVVGAPPPPPPSSSVSSRPPPPPSMSMSHSVSQQGYGYDAAGYAVDPWYSQSSLADEKVAFDNMMHVNYPPPLPPSSGVGYGFSDPRMLTPAPTPPSGGTNGMMQPLAPPTQRSESHQAWAQRQALPKRGLTRKVKLTRGHWVVDHRVPTAIRNSFEPKWTNGVKTNEFTHMRYTAATCDPDDFTKENGWTLRSSNHFGRETELLIAITYYNEDRILLARTLHGVMLNIRDICKMKSKFWRRSAEEGRPGWQRIVVALIFDGIDPCDKAVLDLLATVGVFQDGVMKRQVDGKDTVAHIFEYTTQLSVDAKPSLVQPHGDAESNLVPVQMIFCLKQKNSKKINSHRWLFNALGRHLQPEMCILLDAGTKPSPRSLYHLWEAMYNDKNLGGCCGEIHAMTKRGTKLINPLVAAQNFEYKMSNILDKPLESAFGYVTVLPGAFSAYRYRAIQGRPLQQYFHGDHTLAHRLGKKGLHGMGIFTKNMFLAEDRILCFELVFKRGSKWKLGYVKEAKGETDVPEGAAELISQRRRWLNGSQAASIYSLFHFWKIYGTSHNLFRIFFFHLQVFYNWIVLIVTWFALANYWLTFSIIIQFLPNNILEHSSETILQALHWVNLGSKWVYIFFLILQFVLALGNRPKAERRLYVLSFLVFAVLGYYLLAISMWLTVLMFRDLVQQIKGDETFWSVIMTNAASTTVLIASLVATFGVYLVASIMYLDPWHMITSMPAYLGIAPSMINILNVYSFCNLHDVSWGTKGSDKVDALPAVSTKKNKEDTIEEIEVDQQDLDEHFRQVVQRAVAPVVVEEKKEQPTMDDSNRTFRTRLVIFWILCNGALTIAIQNLAGVHYNESELEVKHEEQRVQGYYFKALLWTTFGLSFFKFCGFFVWWCSRLIRKPCRKS